MNDAGRFDGLSERIPGWRPWRVLYDPAHNEDHGKAIASALEQRAAELDSPNGYRVTSVSYERALERGSD